MNKATKDVSGKIHWSNWLAIGIAALSLLVALYTAMVNRDATIMTRDNLEISKKALSSSDVATKQTLNNLSSLRASFETTKNEMATLPPTVKDFSKSLGELRTTVNTQQEQLAGSIENFKITLKGYNEAITGFEDKVNKIAKLTDKQLSLLEEKQKMIEAELNKKPVIMPNLDHVNISDNKTFELNFGVTNFGNKFAKGIEFVLELPDDLTDIETKMILVGKIAQTKLDLIVPGKKNGTDGFTVHPEITGIKFNAPNNNKSIVMTYSLTTEEYNSIGKIYIDRDNMTIKIEQDEAFQILNYGKGGVQSPKYFMKKEIQWK